MARPMNPLPPQSSALGAFAHDLRRLQTAAGRPTLQEMSRRCGVSTASLSKAQSGCHRPSLETVRGYVQACGGDVPAWEQRWHRLRLDLDGNGTHETPDAARQECLSRWASTGQITPPPLDTVEQLRTALRWLLRFHGLSLRALADRAPSYSHSSYGALLAGTRAPGATIVKEFLAGCGVHSSASLKAWLLALVRLQPCTAEEVYGLLHKPDGARALPTYSGIRAASQAVEQALEGLRGAHRMYDRPQAAAAEESIAASYRNLLVALRDAVLRAHTDGFPVRFSPAAVEREIAGRRASSEFVVPLVLLAVPHDKGLQRSVHQALTSARQLLPSFSRPLRPSETSPAGQLSLDYSSAA